MTSIDMELARKKKLCAAPLGHVLLQRKADTYLLAIKTFRCLDTFGFYHHVIDSEIGSPTMGVVSGRVDPASC